MVHIRTWLVGHGHGHPHPGTLEAEMPSRLIRSDCISNWFLSRDGGELDGDPAIRLCISAASALGARKTRSRKAVSRLQLSNK